MQQIDVLAVMDSAQNALGVANLSGPANELIAARDAVRELIEAAGKLRADIFLWRLTGNMPDLSMLAADEERLDNALAGVKGASA
jgi:muconolactone delta-isomerase